MQIIPGGELANRRPAEPNGAQAAPRQPLSTVELRKEAPGHALAVSDEIGPGFGRVPQGRHGGLGERKTVSVTASVNA